MPRKLTDLRVCDNCKGPVGLTFYVVRTSVALVKAQAVNEFMGMHQFFGGRASNALIENFAPAAHDALIVAMDEPEFKELVTELFICAHCYMRPLDLTMLIERANDRKRKEEDDAALNSGHDVNRTT